MSQAEAEERCTGARRASVRLVVPGDSNELGANKRLHWRAEHRLKQKWLENTYTLALVALRTGKAWPLGGKVRVSFIVRRPRLLDPDNAMSSRALKAVLDGIVAVGILQGDTSTHIEIGSVTQEKAKEPEVEIILEEIG